MLASQPACCRTSVGRCQDIRSPSPRTHAICVPKPGIEAHTSKQRWLGGAARAETCRVPHGQRCIRANYRKDYNRQHMDVRFIAYNKNPDNNTPQHTYIPHTPARQESGVEPVTIALSIATQPSTQVLTRTHTDRRTHTHTHTHPQTHHSPQQTKRGVDQGGVREQGHANPRRQQS
jgi:hypothetical protein